MKHCHSDDVWRLLCRSLGPKTSIQKGLVSQHARYSFTSNSALNYIFKWIWSNFWVANAKMCSKIWFFLLSIGFWVAHLKTWDLKARIRIHMRFNANWVSVFRSVTRNKSFENWISKCLDGFWGGQLKSRALNSRIDIDMSLSELQFSVGPLQTAWDSSELSMPANSMRFCHFEEYGVFYKCVGYMLGLVHDQAPLLMIWSLCATDDFGAWHDCSALFENRDMQVWSYVQIPPSKTENWINRACAIECVWSSN